MSEMRRATGALHVFTFKDGLFSTLAHDLRLRLERFDVTLVDDEVQASFDLASLQVEGPVEDGVVRAGYGAFERQRVEATIRDEVLHLARFPTAAFTGRARATAEGFRVDGDLTLVGHTRPFAFDVRFENGQHHAAFDLTPSVWGIPPYKAMLGAIKLKDRVRVALTLVETTAAAV